MSQENVDVARRCIDAFDRRDAEAMRALDHPDVELDFSASVGVDAGVYKGIDAVLRFLESYFNAFEEIAVNPDCFIDAGASVVVPNRSPASRYWRWRGASPVATRLRNVPGTGVRVPAAHGYVPCFAIHS